MEVTGAHRLLTVSESSQVSAARAGVQADAEAAGFDSTDIYRAGIVATELATNLVKHATNGGELLTRVAAGAPEGAIEVLAIDRGPGIADLNTALTDGHSTAGSPGTGFGAVRRLADAFDVYSQQGRGSVVFVRLHAGRRPAAPAGAIEVAGISVAVAGESVCGDAWGATWRQDDVVLAIADGLGHGLYASEAAAAALGAFVHQQGKGGCVPALQVMHEATRHTRGAAAAVAEILPQSRLVRFAGIGNIAGVIIGDEHARQAVSHSGILGQGARTFREYSYPWPEGGHFVFHSDGLTSHWSLDGYPGVRMRHPAIMAALLYRDHSRQRDDVTVVVAGARR
jgi:anti-sigma regulatory factor (Ser/Thr protein kinase)